MEKVVFVLSEQQQSVAFAAGSSPMHREIGACPYEVGDFIRFPDSDLLYRVQSRIARLAENPAERCWILQLEIAANPMPGL